MAAARGSSSSIAPYYYTPYTLPGRSTRQQLCSAVGFTSTLLLGSRDSAALVTQYWEDSLFFNSCAAKCVRKNARCPFLCCAVSFPPTYTLWLHSSMDDGRDSIWEATVICTLCNIVRQCVQAVSWLNGGGSTVILSQLGFQLPIKCLVAVQMQHPL